MVHTVELRLCFTSQHIKENVDFDVFYDNGKSFVNVSPCRTFKTSLVFINSYQAMVYIKVDIQLLLGRIDVKDDDLFQVNKKIEEYAYMVFNEVDISNMVLHTFDYCYDIYMPEDVRTLFLELVSQKALNEVDRYEKYVEYGNGKSNPTIYYNSKSNKKTFIDKEGKEKNSKVGKSKVLRLYDKDSQSRIMNLSNIDCFRDIVRFETSLKNRHLNYKKYKEGTPKIIESYLKEVLFFKYIAKEFDKVLYQGDYMKLEDAKKIIQDSKLSNNDKKKLYNFLRKASNNPLEKVKVSVSAHEFRKCINILNELGINPIPIRSREKVNLIENPIKSLFELEEKLKM